MIFGDKLTCGIECYHDPLPSPTGNRWVFGRMCLWLAGRALGDIQEPACMLNVTQGRLEDVLKQFDALDDPAFAGLADHEAFELLNHALYLGDERSAAQVAADAVRFWKFDFLTNGGESFDRSKSFLIRDGDRLRILFEDDAQGFVSAHVESAAFVSVVRGFLQWVEHEGDKNH